VSSSANPALISKLREYIGPQTRLLDFAPSALGRQNEGGIRSMTVRKEEENKNASIHRKNCLGAHGDGKRHLRSMRR
jgi:hypothetical protein